MLSLDFHAALCSEKIGKQMRQFYLARAISGRNEDVAEARSFDIQAASLLVSELIKYEEGKTPVLWTNEHVLSTENFSAQEQRSRQQRSQQRSHNAAVGIPSTFILLSSLQPVPTIDLVLFKLNWRSLFSFIGTSFGLLYSYFSLASRTVRSD